MLRKDEHKVTLPPIGRLSVVIPHPYIDADAAYRLGGKNLIQRSGKIDFGLLKNAWLEIAGRRSTEISTPSWKEVNTMRDRSFPNVALKYSFVEKTLSRDKNIVPFKVVL
jgi:hypothetical protein